MKKIKLGELCKPSAGQIKEDSDKLIDYIDISSVDNETKKVTGYQTIAFRDAPSRARKMVKRGSILVSTVRPNLNAVAMLEDDTPNITIASTGFCILDCKENANNRFIFNFCKSRAFIDDMVSQATGASYPAVSDKIVRSALVPDYSYEEQCKISEVLDRLSAVIDNRKAELSVLDELIRARFVEMFGDPRSNPFGFPKSMLKDTCKVVTGNTPPRAAQEYYGDYVEWIKTDNIVPEMINPTKATESLSEEGIKVGRTVGKNSILMACIAGSIASIGKVCVTDRTVAFNQQINAVISKEYNILFLYVMLQLSKDYLVEEINMSLKGILSKSKLEEKEFIVPPIDLQEQFAEFVEQVDKSKDSVQKALDEAQLLFDSLMQQYFG